MDGQAVAWSVLGSPDGATPSHLRLQLMSSAWVEDMASGEVSKPETLNYRTLRAERDGLFCEEIFGQLDGVVDDDYRGALQRAAKETPRGEDPAAPNPRGDRFGRVRLARPIVHPLFVRRDPTWLREISRLSTKELDEVLLCEKFIVIDPVDSDLESGWLVDEAGLGEARQEHPEIAAGTGALALRRAVEAAGAHAPMIIDAIPVLPAQFRPLVPLDGGRFATSDLNDLYRRTINRNNRLRRLLELDAPEIIIRNEVRCLQESVDALFDNDKAAKVVTGPDRRALVSLLGLADLEGGLWPVLDRLDRRVATDGPIVLERDLSWSQYRVIRALEAMCLRLVAG